MKPKSYLPYILAGAAGSIVTAFLPLLLSHSQAETKLLPFQGRLTDAGGNAIADGAKVVEFKMYDAPTGGNVKWAGEVHKLSVNGGLVNTMLGSKAGLGSVDFSTPCYLQITVDAQAAGLPGNGTIDAADPPLLPRQSVVSAVFASEAGNARDSVKLAGADWSSIMVDGAGSATNVPGTGFLKGAKIQSLGITGAQLAGNSVDASKIVDGSVGNTQLSANAVTSDKIVNGTILTEDLSSGLQTSLVLPGTVVSYAGATVPANSGWLLCDGSAVSRTTYAGLYGAIGTTHGVGDAATTFNLPDYRGRFLRGVDDPDGAGGLAAAGRDPDVAGRKHMVTGLAVGGSVGSVQDDAFQGHGHKHEQGTAAGNTQGTFYGVNGNGIYQAGRIVDPVKYNDSFGEVRISSETRPKNAYVNDLIKY